MRKSAFTLIELLVVIAIIAILAAILFPVFAQAKLAAKKTASISNVKNLGTAAQVYLSDNDDTFPLGAVYNPFSGRVSANRFVPTPASLCSQLLTGTQAAQCEGAASAFWSNSLYPYVKSFGIYDDSIGTSTTSIYNLSFVGVPNLTYTGVDAQKNNFAFNYNGLLNAMSSSTPANSSALILFALDGNRKTPGAALTNPTLQCSDVPAANFVAPTCVYVPTATGCTAVSGLGNTAFNGQTSFWSSSTGGAGWSMYNSTWPVVFADSHAKANKIGAGTGGSADNPKLGPFAYYAPTDPFGKLGTSGGMKRWWSSPVQPPSPTSPSCHAYMFQPDIDLNSTTTQPVGQ